jgi:hypothetical protein
MAHRRGGGVKCSTAAPGRGDGGWTTKSCQQAKAQGGDVCVQGELCTAWSTSCTARHMQACERHDTGRHAGCRTCRLMGEWSHFSSHPNPCYLCTHLCCLYARSTRFYRPCCPLHCRLRLLHVQLHLLLLLLLLSSPPAQRPTPHSHTITVSTRTQAQQIPKAAQTHQK